MLMQTRTRKSVTFAMVIVATATTAVSAQDLTDLLQRKLPQAAERQSAAELLELALLLEKGDGRTDSAVVVYRQVLQLRGGSVAIRHVATVARRRLRRLAPGDDALTDAPDRGPLPGRLTMRTVQDVTARMGLGGRQIETTAHGAARLSLDGRRRQTTLNGTTSSRRGVGLRHATELDGRRWGGAIGWLDPLRGEGRLLPRAPTGSPQSGYEAGMKAVSRTLGSIRAALGITGLAEYVSEVARRNRPRPLTPHEHLLTALHEERENKDFADACVRYRELVQLSSTGGIATHLTNRARQLHARCQRWQRASAAGS